jgi:UDP-N-acetylmuramoyl-tripeptide--D-alanyl-D-alanine ligase
MELTAREIAHLTGGEVIRGDPAARATSYAIDSRVLEVGACFVALDAERDGHEFVVDAAARGASIALVARRVHVGDTAPIALVRVGDPLQALGVLGGALVTHSVCRWWASRGRRARPAPRTHRRGVGRFAGQFAVRRAECACESGSYNNEAGLRRSRCSTRAGRDAVVLEMAPARRHRGAVRDRSSDRRRDHQRRAGPRRSLGGPAGVAPHQG